MKRYKAKYKQIHGREEGSYAEAADKLIDTILDIRKNGANAKNLSDFNIYSWSMYRPDSGFILEQGSQIIQQAMELPL